MKGSARIKHREVIVFRLRVKKKGTWKRRNVGKAEAAFRLSESWTGLIAFRNCFERYSAWMFHYPWLDCHEFL